MIEMKKRKKIGPMLVFPFLIIASIGAFLVGRVYSCSNEVDVSIGNYPTIAVGQRASLQRLAYEIKRCPKAQLFIIRRNDRGLKLLDKWLDNNYDFTMYSRKDDALDDDNPVLGSYEEWNNVSDRAIEKVASSSGNFNDFAKYGCQDPRP